jgi:type IV pilus biogenesis protein PilP
LLVATGAIAQVPGAASSQAVNTSVAAPVASTAVVPAPVPLLFGGEQGASNANSNRLEEISNLKYRKAKLELEKEIAELQAKIEEAQTGGAKKAAPGMPPGFPVAAMPQMMDQPKPPSMSEVLFESVYVASIYGDVRNLTAEVVSSKGKVIGKAGTYIHTGERIIAVTPEYVILSKGKTQRTLTPASGAGQTVEMPRSMSTNQQAAPSMPQMGAPIYPNPAEVFGQTNRDGLNSDKPASKPPGL